MHARIRILPAVLVSGLMVSAPLALSAESAAPASEAEFTPIFNGKDLEGWDGDPRYWRVEDGMLVGEVTPATLLQRNSFIIWRGGTVCDFELKLEYRVSEKGNSGVNYRSLELEGLPYSMRGYQADIDGGDRWTANNYEERGRTFIAMRGQRAVVQPGERPRVVEVFADPDELQKRVVRKGDWNSFHLIVRGDHHQQWLNGTLMNEAWDHDHENGTQTGLLGVQVHIGPPMKIEYRNIELARFPRQDSPQTRPIKEFTISTTDYEKLLTFPTMEGLEFMQQQATRLTRPPAAAPLGGKQELTIKSPVYLVRHDLGLGQPDGVPAGAKDIVLIDGDTVVRIPDAASEFLDRPFEQESTWRLKWDSGRQAYEILEVQP